MRALWHRAGCERLPAARSATEPAVFKACLGARHDAPTARIQIGVTFIQNTSISLFALFPGGGRLRDSEVGGNDEHTALASPQERQTQSSPRAGSHDDRHARVRCTSRQCNSGESLTMNPS